MKKMIELFILLACMVLNTYGSDQKPEANPEANIVPKYDINRLLFDLTPYDGSEINNKIAEFVVDTRIKRLTPMENLSFEMQIKEFNQKYPDINFNRKEMKALAIPVSEQNEKLKGVCVIQKNNPQNSSVRRTYSKRDYELARKVPQLIKEKLETPDQVNVHKPRTPYQNILKQSGMGFMYGFTTGLLLGVGCGYMQKRTSSEVNTVALVGGIGFGLAGGFFAGTKQILNEFNEYKLTDIEIKKL